jgi:hypothetical protein
VSTDQSFDDGLGPSVVHVIHSTASCGSADGAVTISPDRHAESGGGLSPALGRKTYT